MTATVSPLHPILAEINRAASGGFPFLAIAMTLALPDICVSLVSDDGRTDGNRYKDWCKNNLGAAFNYVTADDLWSMRCGFVHNGRFGDLSHNVARVIFALPSQGTFVNNKVNDAYFYNVVDFCANFTKIVEQWFEANKDLANVKANLPRLMQYHPQGLAPYVRGVPVIA